MNKLFTYAATISCFLLFFACYSNKKDISTPTANALKAISFRDDVVPIVTSGACGCHNNGTTRAIQFSTKDTIYYNAIQARAGIFNDMVNGKEHPAEGGIYFTPSQAAVIKTWIQQGAKDNYVPPPVTGPVTYSINIVPIYKAVCKGSACHGGLGPNLDYAKMVSDKDQLSVMMSSGGATGHKGGSLSLDATTTQTFLAWIAQGLPQ
ncbi:MAG: hypothetical protein WCP74_01965 [Sphingobacteriia bacterium]|jgi:hypothetical protein